MSKPDLDWGNLNFQYQQTPYHLEYTYCNGSWDEGELRSEPYVKLHIAATCLHYGQEAFEGLKAFPAKDGKINIFRLDENYDRMKKSAGKLIMELVPFEIFRKAIITTVKENIEYVPPYGTDASMYIRPLLIGSGPRIGVHPSDEFKFIVLVLPVGPYYKNGFLPVKSMVIENFDRSASLGMGAYKIGGNYAASMMAMDQSSAAGYPISLFLDAKEHKYIDEFGTSNFIGITKDKKYVTPDSASILKSITNKSLMAIAREMGLQVEQRRIKIEELSDFDEVGACGTACVITPICSVSHRDKLYTFGESNKPGTTLVELYNRLTGIQFGELPDTHNWLTEVV